MAQKNYGELEKRVISLFASEGRFYFQGKEYKVTRVGKPQPQHGSGESKTDVYILGAAEDGTYQEIKLSLKLKFSNEFQENKVSAERAESFFGEGYKQIIEEATRSIAHEFEQLPLVFASGKHPVKPDSITVGWKLEIASKPRKLSAPIQLSEEQVRQFIYRGVNLPLEKRDAVVNGEIVTDSGVADYILYAELNDLQSTEDVINRMQLIEEVPIEPTYLIFTANNYRTAEGKSDGNRPVAVRIEWYTEGNKLAHRILYDNPLDYTGKDMVVGLTRALGEIGKNHPKEMIVDDLLVPTVLLP